MFEKEQKRLRYEAYEKLKKAIRLTSEHSDESESSINETILSTNRSNQPKLRKVTMKKSISQMKKKNLKHDESNTMPQLPPVLGNGHQKALSMFNPTNKGTKTTLELAQLAGGQLNLDLLKDTEYNQKQMQIR